jgi:hypothetical protein
MTIIYKQHNRVPNPYRQQNETEGAIVQHKIEQFNNVTAVMVPQNTEQAKEKENMHMIQIGYKSLNCLNRTKVLLLEMESH